MSTIWMDNQIDVNGWYITPIYGFPTTIPDVNSGYYTGSFKDCQTSFTDGEVTIRIVKETQVVTYTNKSFLRSYLYAIRVGIYGIHSITPETPTWWWIRDVMINNSSNYSQHWNFIIDMINPVYLGIYDSQRGGIAANYYHHNNSSETPHYSDVTNTIRNSIGISRFYLYDYSKSLKFAPNYNVSNFSSKIISVLNNYSSTLKTIPYYKSLVVSCLYNNITIAQSNLSKTYTNSTWSTSKTWYIKVTYSKNSTSNVVNYDTIYVTKSLLYMKILIYFFIPTILLLTKELMISVPNGTDYYIMILMSRYLSRNIVIVNYVTRCRIG